MTNVSHRNFRGAHENLANSTSSSNSPSEVKRVFVVEDEIIISKDIQRLLKRLGYQVAGAAISGAAALEGIAQHAPNLILMDIHIKGDWDGIETAGQVLARFDVPVIYLSAFADKITIERAKKTAHFGYLLKPFEERELGAAIETAFQEHEAERLLRDRKHQK